MGGSVSITNECELENEDIWTELSVGYPYHFNSSKPKETIKLNCGRVWLSVKVTAFRDDSRDKAKERRTKGEWMIVKGSLAVATLGVSLLAEFTDFLEVFTNHGSGAADVGEGGIEALVREVAPGAEEEVQLSAEGSAASDEENTKSAKHVWKWVTGAAGGLAFMDVGRGVGNKNRGITFVIGHIRRGVYAGWHPSFNVVSKNYRRGSDAPPVDRVDAVTWREFKKLRKFDELVLLTLVDA